MTDAELEAIEARAAAATPGPWEHSDTWAAESFAMSSHPFNSGDHVAVFRRVPDEDFCAHARQDIPALLAEVRRLREALGDAIEWVEEGLEFERNMGWLKAADKDAEACARWREVLEGGAE